MSAITSAGREICISGDASTQTYEKPIYGANEERRYGQHYPLTIFKKEMLTPLSDDDKETMFRENRIAVHRRIIIGNRNLMFAENVWYVSSVDDFKRITLINKKDYPEPTFIELPIGGVLIISKNDNIALSPSIFTNMDSAVPRVEEALRGHDGGIIAIRHIDNWGRKLIWFEGIHYIYEAQPHIITIDNNVYESFKIWKLYQPPGEAASQFLILSRIYAHFAYSVFDSSCQLGNAENVEAYIKDIIFKNKLFDVLNNKGAARFVEYYNNSHLNKVELTNLEDLFKIIRTIEHKYVSNLKFRKWILILYLIKDELDSINNQETINKMIDLLEDF